jgi:hypothetical protein
MIVIVKFQKQSAKGVYIKVLRVKRNDPKREKKIKEKKA